MMFTSVRRLLAAALLSCLFVLGKAQPPVDPGDPAVKKENRPYKVLTSGKQVTIKSSKNINHIMLWTSGGNRVVEQKEINASSFTFTIPVSEKVYFLMVGLTDGKIYTEKIGLQ